MNPQRPEDEAAMIDAIASRQMGVPPQQAAPPMPDPKADAKQKTPDEQASEKGAPETEADRMEQDAILYEIEFGEGDKRKLTPAQIKNTFERYGQMNAMQAHMRPIMALMAQVMRDNPGVPPQQLAQQMEKIYRAQAHNPEMGGQGKSNQQVQPGQQGQQGQGENEDLASQLKKWEEENAVALPPGYAEMMQGNGQQLSQMQQQLAQTQRMLQAVLAQSQGMTDAARQGMTQANQSQSMAVRQRIATTIDRVQHHLQIPDEAANDFMVFAAERGYTFEDFADPGLTLKVMSDFKNLMQGPEMERMRDIAQRRQAYTGSLGGSPATGGPGGQGSEMGETFDRLASRAMGG